LLWPRSCCSEDPDVKGTETSAAAGEYAAVRRCSEDPDVKGTETFGVTQAEYPFAICVAARIPM